jgi:DNA-binding SARP family transcriptional activator
MGELTVTLFGSPSLSEDGTPLRLRSRKCMALLAYLAVTGTPHTRPALAALLWPESDTQHALSGLRYTLSWLRRALHGLWVVTDHDTVGLDGSYEQAVDVLQFRALLAQVRTHGHGADQVCPHCLSALAQTAAL